MNKEVNNTEMKNIPKKIYLVVGFGDEETDVDFNELHQVSWCADKQYDSDIEYVLSQPSQISNNTESYTIAQIEAAREGTHIGETLLELLIENLRESASKISTEPIDKAIEWVRRAMIANLDKSYDVMNAYEKTLNYLKSLKQ